MTTKRMLITTSAASEITIDSVSYDAENNVLVIVVGGIAIIDPDKIRKILEHTSNQKNINRIDLPDQKAT